VSQEKFIKSDENNRKDKGDICNPFLIGGISGKVTLMPIESDGKRMVTV
jgi:hypothetical protein